MGSSSAALILAAFCGALYLLFDAARYFTHQLSPVRLRAWSGTDAGFDRGSRWFHYRPEYFSLTTGALLQLSLITGVGSTVAALLHLGLFRAIVVSVLVWALVAIVWKAMLAFVSDETGERLLRGLIPVSYLFYLVFWPFLFPLRKLLGHVLERREANGEEDEVTDEDVQAFIDVGEKEGILEGSEGKLVQSIVDFGDRIARELMTPRIDMLAFEASRSFEELARLFSESKYSRIPIYEETIDRIIGIVHVKDLFDLYLRHDEKDIRDIARPAYFVPESKKVSELLREFQIEHLQIAVVVDEYGGTGGLITIEDVIEEIVGEIADEHEDEEETVVEVQHGVYLVNGSTRIDSLEQLLEIDVRGDDDYETVAGLIFTEMGRVPKVGESVSKNHLLFEVDRADRRRIYRVRVTREPETRAAEVARG